MNTEKSDNINEMYIKNDTLSTRQNLHDKYSVNKYGWHNWVFYQYKFKENINVLELGCGIGSTWIGKEEQIPPNAEIILTDISPLMIEKAREKLNTYSKFSFKLMDIQNMEFEDKKFDMIIANHMLYHVPDITKALSEIKKKLKNDGCFYTTTIGKDSLKELQDIYKNYEDKIEFQYSKDCSFTMENGEEILSPYFRKINKIFYEDSLEVTDVNDLMDYIISYNKIPKDIYDEMYGEIKNKFKGNSIFRISKEQGMFICRL